MKILEAFKDIPYLGYRKRWVKTDPTEDYLLLVKRISQKIKNRNSLLCDKRIKFGVVAKKYVKK